MTQEVHKEVIAYENAEVSWGVSLKGINLQLTLRKIQTLLAYETILGFQKKACENK